MTKLPQGLSHIPAHQYHADSAVSNSMLSSMAKSPAHCYALHLAPGRPTVGPTPAMAAGTLAHTMILEPETFAHRYVTKPADLSLATKEGKAFKASVPEGMELISEDQRDTAQLQRAAVMADPKLASMLASGHAELSAFWTDKATGLRCRCRPDWLQFTGPNRVRVLDIKTIGDITLESVSRSIAAYGYHRQQAHYVAGLEACGLVVEEFVFGFVTNAYPFLALPYVLDDETVAQGSEEVGELLARYAHCHRTNHWPIAGEGCQMVGLPRWAKRETEIEVSYA